MPTRLNEYVTYQEMYVTGLMLFSPISAGYGGSADNISDMFKMGYSGIQYAGEVAVAVESTVALNAELIYSVYMGAKNSALLLNSSETMFSESMKGEYRDVAGHHVHAKAAFEGHVQYDPKRGFSISQQFMLENGLDHVDMTNTQRQLFKELFESGRANTLAEHTRIAAEALRIGGADEELVNELIRQSLENLYKQGVTQPTRIPWYTK